MTGRGDAGEREEALGKGREAKVYETRTDSDGLGLPREGRTDLHQMAAAAAAAAARSCGMPGSGVGVTMREICGRDVAW